MRGKTLSARAKRRGDGGSGSALAAARPMWRHAGLLLAAAALLAGLTGCDQKTSKVSPFPRPQNVYQVTYPNPALTQGTVSAAVPAAAVSMGMVLQGASTHCRLIDHGSGIVSWPDGAAHYITGPAGSVPLAFNQIDFGLATGGAATGLENDYSILADDQVAAVLFPNQGQVGSLAAGTYAFPIVTANNRCASATAVQADAVTATVLYKTTISVPQTLKMNVWVVSGVGGLATVAQANTDPEVQGALQLLRNAYQANANVGVSLQLVVGIVPDASYAIIDTDAEGEALFSSYPSPAANDAINIFIVSTLANAPAGVLGYAARIQGPFTQQGTIKSGTVAEYQGDGTGQVLGYILAHEFGHYLGLFHTSQTDLTQTSIFGEDPIADTPVCTNADIAAAGSVAGCPDATNLMFPVAVSSSMNPVLTPGQGIVIQLNPAVHE